MDQVGDLLRQQDGVIARAQLLEAGLVPSQVRRLLRRRELCVVFPGVYLDHTGQPTWSQRSWAAVLSVAPAALWGESALRAEDGPGRRGFDEAAPIHVAVAHDRHLRRVPGVVVHRVRGLDRRVQWNRSPARVRIEEAVLDVAAAANREIDAIAVVAAAVGSRRTTAGRLREALGRRSRIRRRAFLTVLLDDVAAGACSVLEHGYLTKVERAHALPTADRQTKASVHGPVFRDVYYPRFGRVIELDGQLDHTHLRDRDADLDRDLAAAADGLSSVRLGWGQVFERHCWTAVQVGRLLTAGGWAGTIRRCPECPG